MQVHKIFLRRLSVLELSATEFSVLVLVGANPGVYLRQLGSALDVSPPNLVAVVDRLVQRGVLARLPSAEDRRLQELHLTDAGRHLLARAEAQVEMFETGLEQSLSAAERRCLDSALKKLAAFDPPRADPPGEPSGDPRDDPNQAGA